MVFYFLIRIIRVCIVVCNVFRGRGCCFFFFFKCFLFKLSDICVKFGLGISCLLGILYYVEIWEFFGWFRIYGLCMKVDCDEISFDVRIGLK